MPTSRTQPPESAWERLAALERPLWVLLAATEEGRGGLTASWVQPASLDPSRPILLISLGVTAHTTQLVEHAGAFSACLLAADQSDVAWNFCRDSGRDRDKLDGLALADGMRPPVLADCLAGFRCRVDARLVAGDRALYWGSVQQQFAGARERDSGVLTDSAFYAALPAADANRLESARQQDAQAHRELRDQWLRNLPASLSPSAGARDGSD